MKKALLTFAFLITTLIRAEGPYSGFNPTYPVTGVNQGAAVGGTVSGGLLYDNAGVLDSDAQLVFNESQNELTVGDSAQFANAIYIGDTARQQVNSYTLDGDMLPAYNWGIGLSAANQFYSGQAAGESYVMGDASLDLYGGSGSFDPASNNGRIRLNTGTLQISDVQVQIGTAHGTATTLINADGTVSLAAGGATFTSAGVFDPNLGIVGTATNDSATAGHYGQYTSSITAAASLATSTEFGNHGQVSLTAGDWDVTGSCEVVANGATVTAMKGAISINSANTTTDHVAGHNEMRGFLATAANNSDVLISNYRLSLAGTTTVYVKVAGTYAVATPTAACRISARRMR